MSDLPAGWEWTTLSEVASWGSGGTPNRAVRGYYRRGVPWAVIGDLNDAVVTETAESISADGLAGSSAKLVREGAVLIAMYGSIGKLGIAGIPMATNQAIAFAEPHSGVLHAKYLFHYLYSQRADLLSVGKGATQRNISQTVLRSWPFLLPPVEEQERIVVAIEEHLSRLDAAKAAVRISGTRIDTLRKTLISDVLERRPWPIVTWGDVGQTLSGRAFPSVAYRDDGIRLLRPGNLGKSGRLAWTHKATTYLPESFAFESPKYVLEGRSLLINLTAQSLADDFLGRVCLSDDDDRFLLNQRIAKLSSPSALDEYLFWVFRSGAFRRFVSRLNTGSLIQHISTKQLASFVFPLPPVEEQKSIVEEIESAMDAVDRLGSAVDLVPRRSSLLRRAILATAFAGQLVPQDPEDEPASVLLRRSRHQRPAATSRRRPRAQPTHGEAEGDSVRAARLWGPMREGGRHDR